MFTNFAQRANDHNYRFDPIVRSLFDTDFYKLLMLQFIWLLYRTVTVTFGLINRTKSVRLGDDIDEMALRAQLDNVMTLAFAENGLIWLAGNKFYGRRDIFRPDFIHYLRTEFKLSPYTLERKDGQYVLTFHGTWPEVTMWEIYALTIVSELRTRAGLLKMSEGDIDQLYAKAKVTAWDDVQKLCNYEHSAELRLADFGTRRRHSFLWQEWVVQMMANEMGPRFTGTSNAYLAMKHGLDAIGTNAHELPMVLATLANTSDELHQAPYKVLADWETVYEGALRVFLPDTYGTTGFLRDAPDFVANWSGARLDSKDPFVGGEELIAWWKTRGQDPLNKLTLFSDGLNIPLVIDLHRAFRGRTRVGFGLGTHGTNNFAACHPRGLNSFAPISLVCKVIGANNKGAVKLSDNYTKATGADNDIADYRKTFGTEGVANIPVVV